MSLRRLPAVPLAIGVLGGLSAATSLVLLALLLHGPITAFSVFYDAARTLGQGANPYHAVRGVAVDGAFQYLPWVAILLRPITAIPYWTAFYLWVTLSGLLALGSTWALARAAGWRRTWPLVAGVAIWAVLWRGLLTGQMDGLELALETLAVLAAIRRRPAAAGAMAVVAALLKPQLLWLLPLALLVLAGRERQGTRFAVGGAVAAVALVGAPAVLEPALVPAWAHSLLAFSSSIRSVQPDLAGLPGLLRFAPPGWGLRPGLASPPVLALLAPALVLIGWLLQRAGTGRSWGQLPRATRVLWVAALPVGVWILVSPYSHSNDLLVLLPLVILALGPDGRLAVRPSSLTALAALVVFPEFFLLFDPGSPVSQRSLAGLAVLCLVILAMIRSPWAREFAPASRDHPEPPAVLPVPRSP